MPDNAREYFETLRQKLSELGFAVATVMGRYYAMDRDRRGTGPNGYNAWSSARASRPLPRWKQWNWATAGRNRRIIQPTVIMNSTGEPVARVEMGTP